MGLAGLIVSTVIVGTSILIGIGYKKLFKVKDDHPVEEMCEKIIKERTGIDIDFTPSSKEKDDKKKQKEKKNEDNS